MESTKSTRAAKPKEATALLRADHKAVSALFADYETARSTAKKKAIVVDICTELTIHAQIEEEIFYPAIKPLLKDKTLVPEAQVEHATLKALIADLEGGDPDGLMYDAKVMVLSEYVKHHVKEEQNEIFPQVKTTKLDLAALGKKLAERKAQLQNEPERKVTLGQLTKTWR